MQISLNCVFQKGFAHYHNYNRETIFHNEVRPEEIKETVFRWLNILKNSKGRVPFREIDPVLYKALEEFDFIKAAREIEKRMLEKTAGELEEVVGHRFFEVSKEHISRATLHHNGFELVCGCMLYFKNRYELCEWHDERVNHTLAITSQLGDHYSIQFTDISNILIHTKIQHGNPVINVIFYQLESSLTEAGKIVYQDDDYEVCVRTCGCMFVNIKAKLNVAGYHDDHVFVPAKYWLIDKHEHLKAYSIPQKDREMVIRLLFKSEDVPDAVKKMLCSEI